MASPSLKTIDDIEILEQYWVAKSRTCFWSYAQYMTPKLKKGWWQRHASKALTQWYEDFILALRPVLVIEAPPQHGKSFLIVLFISWLVGKNADWKAIYASFSDDLGVRANGDMQRLLDSDKYRKIFPDTHLGGSNVVTGFNKPKRNSALLEFDKHAGSFSNTTVMGQITGKGMHIGVIDDPLKGRDAANSPTIRDKTWNWFVDDFFTRLDEQAGIIAILTRWHIDDPIGRLKKQRDNVTCLRYPALSESGTKLMDDDPRREGGNEALFPQHKSVAFLMEQKTIRPEASWQSLYQQNPIILGGNFFKGEWWQYYTVLPEMKYTMIYGDTAQKTKEQNDYSVFQWWGMGVDGKIYLLDQIRDKWESPDLLVHAKAFWNKCRTSKIGVCRQIKIEDKSSGTGLIQQLIRDGVPVMGIPRNTDKESRAADVSPQIKVGNVVLPEDAPWLSDYLAEFAQFPSGKNDDQVDPTMDAITDMLIQPNQPTVMVGRSRRR